jgi:hypothetical protein
MSNEIFFKEYAKGEKPPFHIFKETLNQNVRGSKMELQDIIGKEIKKFYIMFQGKPLGIIQAKNYEEARMRIEEVITIEEEGEGD